MCLWIIETIKLTIQNWLTTSNSKILLFTRVTLMRSYKTLTYWNNLAIRSWRNDSCRCSLMLNVTCLNKSNILAHFWWFVKGTKIRRSVKVAWIRILSLRKIETDLSMEHSLVSKFNATVTKLFWPSSVLLASAAVRRDFFRFSTFTVSIHWMSINNVGHEEINLAFDVFERVWNKNELCKRVFGLLMDIDTCVHLNW